MIIANAVWGQGCSLSSIAMTHVSVENHEPLKGLNVQIMIMIGPLLDKVTLLTLSLM